MSGHSKWENIKRKKGKTDAIRAKITTKISKEITIAARMGGGDPVGNMRLKLALTKAKQNNVPKDNIQRAIAKGVGAASGAGFDEITYEGYGPGGAAVIVECNTDNRNRAAADVRHAFTHHGGSIGTPGCVAWMFKKKGMIVVNKEAADEDTIMMIALDAGAEDVSTDGDSFEITTAPEDFLTVCAGRVHQRRTSGRYGIIESTGSSLCFFAQKSGVDLVSADFAADGTKKEPLRIFSFIRILFICLEMVIQADTEAVFAGGLISVIVGIVHVKVERGGDEAKPETHFIFSFLGR